MLVEIEVQMSPVGPEMLGKLFDLVHEQDSLYSHRPGAGCMGGASSASVGHSGDVVAGTGAYTEVVERQEETSVALGEDHGGNFEGFQRSLAQSALGDQKELVETLEMD